MSAWIKRLAIAAVVILVIAAAVNDIGKYFSGLYALDNVTREAATRAARVARDNPSTSSAAGLKAMEIARNAGATVYGFDQANDRCTVWTRGTVEGTWVWGPVTAAIAGRPYSQWWGSPVPITGRAEAIIY